MVNYHFGWPVSTSVDLGSRAPGLQGTHGTHGTCGTGVQRGHRERWGGGWTWLDMAGHGWTWLDMAGLTQVTSSSSNATCIDTQVGRQRKRNTETNRDRGNREMLLKAKHSTARLKHQFPGQPDKLIQDRCSYLTLNAFFSPNMLSLWMWAWVEIPDIRTIRWDPAHFHQFATQPCHWSGPSKLCGWVKRD